MLSYANTYYVLNTFESAPTGYNRYLVKYSMDGLKISLKRINRLRCYPDTNRTHKIKGLMIQTCNANTLLLHAAEVKDCSQMACDVF